MSLDAMASSVTGSVGWLSGGGGNNNSNNNGGPASQQQPTSNGAIGVGPRNGKVGGGAAGGGGEGSANDSIVGWSRGGRQFSSSRVVYTRGLYRVCLKFTTSEDEDEGFNQNIESLVGQLRCAPARPRTRARARRAIARTWAPAGPHGSLRHVGGRCRRVNNLRWYNGGVLARQHP